MLAAALSEPHSERKSRPLGVLGAEYRKWSMDAFTGVRYFVSRVTSYSRT